MVRISLSNCHASDAKLTTISFIRGIIISAKNVNGDMPMIWAIDNIKLVINMNGEARSTKVRINGEAIIGIV